VPVFFQSNFKVLSKGQFSKDRHQMAFTFGTYGGVEIFLLDRQRRCICTQAFALILFGMCVRRGQSSSRKKKYSLERNLHGRV